MKSHFRLYSDNKTDFNSSIFDLISGEKETKQTKGLAYILSQYKEFLFAFLDLEAIKPEIKKLLKGGLKRGKITTIEISAERFTVNKKRADIVIKLDSDKKPLLAIIIEAKSIKANYSQQTLCSQIEYYLDPRHFPDLKAYIKIGIVLTKFNQNIPNVINISWNRIIQLLSDFCNINKNEIVKQYFNFLTQIDKTMKYYEQEVLSVPAGRSLQKVKQYFIYVCPDTKNYNYKKPLYITFRESKGGVMDKLYKIEEIIILNPTNQNEINTLKNSTYPEKYKKRIINYINNSNYSEEFDYEERFYLLSETDSISLVNKPKPPKPFRKHTYYSLTDILTKTIVKSESQKGKLQLI